ncbi:MAG TPA: hypothetical protein VIP28_15145, partial [Nocardioides sp.]
AGAIATMIYSIPPAIRITALAIEQVSPTAVEASSSLGATGRQTPLPRFFSPPAGRTAGPLRVTRHGVTRPDLRRRCADG